MCPLPPPAPLFPYTTLFRSLELVERRVDEDRDRPRHRLLDCQRALELELEGALARSEEHTSELQSLRHLVCRLLLEKKKKRKQINNNTRFVTNHAPALCNLD